MGTSNASTDLILEQREVITEPLTIGELVLVICHQVKDFAQLVSRQANLWNEKCRLKTVAGK